MLINTHLQLLLELCALSLQLIAPVSLGLPEHGDGIGVSDFFLGIILFANKQADPKPRVYKYIRMSASAEC